MECAEPMEDTLIRSEEVEGGDSLAPEPANSPSPHDQKQISKPIEVIDPEQDSVTRLQSLQIESGASDVDVNENTKDSDVVAYVPPQFESVPSLVYEEQFATFTKGVKFCPDGRTFAVCTDDRCVHLRRTEDLLDAGNIPDEVAVEKVATVREAQPIHDFAWNPKHDVCNFVVTCNTQPVHLYCGQTGKFLCSYVARNHLDEHISAYSVTFDRAGDRLFAGFKKFVRVFEVDRPKQWFEVATWKSFQAGIVSAMDVDSTGHLLAVGTYCNTVALYDLRSNKGTMAEEPQEGHEGGVTQVRFSFDGTLLYSGARKDDFILCRDVRHFDQILYKFPRKVVTQQRIHFDFPYEENYLATGNTDGTCFLWNLRQLEMFGDEMDQCRPSLVFMPHSDVRLTQSSATNGVSFHRWAPIIATSSGGRVTNRWDDEAEEIVWESAYENRVKLWKFSS